MFYFQLKLTDNTKLMQTKSDIKLYM